MSRDERLMTIMGIDVVSVKLQVDDRIDASSKIWSIDGKN
jgi:hypothetical protein